MAKPGDRVLAIRNVDEDTAYVFGSGVYEGDKHPPTGPFGQTYEEVREVLRKAGWVIGQIEDYITNYTNPMIRLDNGNVVWGFQCWWGDEEKIAGWVGDRELVVVPIEPYYGEPRETEDA